MNEFTRKNLDRAGPRLPPPAAAGGTDHRPVELHLTGLAPATAAALPHATVDKVYEALRGVGTLSVRAGRAAVTLSPDEGDPHALARAIEAAVPAAAPVTVVRS